VFEASLIYLTKYRAFRLRTRIFPLKITLRLITEGRKDITLVPDMAEITK
jgi:hypothetical protein